MKLKGLTKLAISGVALGAATATFATSTYAWYVSNAEATITTLTGATATGAAEGNLLLSEDNEEYGAKLTLSDGVGIKKDGTLNPLHGYLNAAGEMTFGTIQDQGNITTDYKQYEFYIKNTGTSSALVSPMLIIQNTATATSVTKQKAFSTQGAPSGVAANADFFVDAVQALRVAIKVGNNDMTIYAADTAFNYGSTGAATAYTTLQGAATGGDANKYYTKLTGECPADMYVGNYGATEPTEKVYFYSLSDDKKTVNLSTAGATAISAPTGNWRSNLTLGAADTGVKITVYVWLEGWDPDCFDTCKNQTFSFDFKFTDASNDKTTGGN